ncbi:MAG: AarF/ABC1/UbiB kinase family protein [Proteobacteria bacterium]|nr:AarF/ABC1/UbiB kinase family protein [Pseudomonadota bacterium]
MPGPAPNRARSSGRTAVGRALRTSEQVFRARRIGTTFGRVYLGIKAQQWIARQLRPRDMQARWSRFHRDSAESIYSAAVDLRGLVLKGCQFLGSRADVVPPEYVETLSRLQDRVPPKSFRVVRERVERELDRPLAEAFAEFSETPIAAASLAQVHLARLRSGERVAVKVQYPEIERLVRADLAQLRVLFRAVGWLERDFDLMPVVEELGRQVPQELDFESEARNAERVAALLAHREDVRVPSVHWPLTTRRVLVSEYVEGVKISDVANLRQAGHATEQLARTLVEAYCEQILVHGFFHADPHPGNLLVTPAGQLVFLDFGLCKELPSGFREAVVGFAAALVQGRPEAMAAALAQLGFETRDGGTRGLEEISEILLDVGKRLRGQAWIDPDVVRDAGRELPERIRRNPIVRVPGHVVLLGRVLGLLSGVGRSLGGRVDMLGLILPYAMGQRTSDG